MQFLDTVQHSTPPPMGSHIKMTKNKHFSTSLF